MVKIPVGRLRPGMITARPIIDEEVTIVGAGMILSGRHITALKEREIDCIEIAEDGEIETVNVHEVVQSAQVDDQQVANAAEELADRVDAVFADVMDDDVMATLAENAKVFLVAKMQA